MDMVSMLWLRTLSQRLRASVHTDSLYAGPSFSACVYVHVTTAVVCIHSVALTCVNVLLRGHIRVRSLSGTSFFLSHPVTFVYIDTARHEDIYLVALGAHHLTKLLKSPAYTSVSRHRRG